MRSSLFVDPGSVVRRIWGDPDVILLVFAGAAAEFALNRAVDWLYVTGSLPANPIERLFSTAAYAREIVFADQATAERTLSRIRAAHAAVERMRRNGIPDWAHRDVLYLLIDYSERAHGLLHRSLTPTECDDLYDVFHRVGEGLRIPDLPRTYGAWRVDRELHMRRDLIFSTHTAELYARYRDQLGPLRYQLLLSLQAHLVPHVVADLLGLRDVGLARPGVAAYRALRYARLATVARAALVPRRYLKNVRQLARSLISSIDPRTAAESTQRTPRSDSTSRSAQRCRRAQASRSRRGD